MVKCFWLNSFIACISAFFLMSLDTCSQITAKSTQESGLISEWLYDVVNPPAGQKEGQSNQYKPPSMLFRKLKNVDFIFGRAFVSLQPFYKCNTLFIVVKI